MATGETLLAVTVSGMIPFTATIDRSSRGAPLRGTIKLTNGLDEYVDIWEYVPSNLTAAAAVNLIIGWSAVSATSGNVVLSGAFMSFTDNVDDLDTKTYGTANTATAAVAGAAGQLRYTTIAFTNAQADGIAALEMVGLRVGRVGTNVSDTVASDIELISVSVAEA